MVSNISKTAQKTKPTFLGRNGRLGSGWSGKSVGGTVSVPLLGFVCGIKRNLGGVGLGRSD